MTIHKVTAEDQKVLIENYALFTPISHGSQSVDQPLSIMRARDTKYDLEGKKDKFLQLVEILNLFTDYVGTVQLQYVNCKTPTFYPVEESVAVEIINPRGHSPFASTLTSENTKKLLKFCEKLPNLNVNSMLRFAIKRFNYAKISRIPQEKIVDFVVCLESLFGDPGSKTELRYKFSLRIALLHGKDPDDGKLLRRLFGLFYDARSYVVHGNDHQFKKTLRSIEKISNDWINKLTTIAKDSIISFVNLKDNGIIDMAQVIDESDIDDIRRQEIRTKAGLAPYESY